MDDFASLSLSSFSDSYPVLSRLIHEAALLADKEQGKEDEEEECTSGESYGRTYHFDEDEEPPPLRFQVGTMVACCVGPGIWVEGHVCNLYYVDEDFPPGTFHPYQVLLANDVISAPVDSDECIRFIRDCSKNQETRFEVGTAVSCNIGREGWLPGYITRIGYREKGFPPGVYFPYQICLPGERDDQEPRYVFPDEDTDDYVKLLKESSVTFSWLIEAAMISIGHVGNIIRPENIDPLGKEVGRALQYCTSARPNSARLDPKFATAVLTMIFSIDGSLWKKESGPLLRLWRHSILTSKNLESLLKIYDSDFQNGDARCNALWLLDELSDMSTVCWNVKMAGGITFATKLLIAAAKGIEDETKPGCCVHVADCKDRCLRLARRVLNKAFCASKDKPSDIVSRLGQFNIQAILQYEEGDIEAFFRIHNCCVLSLQREQNNGDAKALLHKLGACHSLFRDVLRRIICGVIFIDEAPRQQGLPEDSEGDAKKFIYQIKSVCTFLLRYCNCLTALPQDRNMIYMVRTAHESLMNRLEQNPSLQFILLQAKNGRICTNTCCCGEALIDVNKLMLYLGESNYLEMANETDEERWSRFQTGYFTTDDGSSSKKKIKNLRHFAKRQNARILDEKVGTEEMCANCFAIQSDQSGQDLMKCSRCQLVTYCSRDCQVAHWKKTHKNQCFKIGKKPAPAQP